MIQNILLATDGSAPAAHATDFAGSLAVQYHAKIIVLHAYNPVSGNLGEPYYSQTLYDLRAQAESLVADVAEHLRELGVVDVVTEIAEGSAVNVILAVAKTRQSDLLVMGARGLSTWQGIILGSVSMAVVQRAECPVLVVK